MSVCPLENEQRTGICSAAHKITTRKVEHNIDRYNQKMTPQKYKITLDQLRMAAVCIVLLYSLHELFSSNVLFPNFSFYLYIVIKYHETQQQRVNIA